MTADEPSWKMLIAFLTVIALSTVLLHAGHKPEIAIMPCFLLSMLMQGRLTELWLRPKSLAISQTGVLPVRPM
ncbi:hypothetical protein [Bradyrhizobium canariense]|uniref:Uncharacterized protein n=1 Tax=Bradyrhizobium canariense TaxID=255045 RepID=A0ABX3XB37_9BRAD|nr:hypothetical protein BST63_03820 [Bradyrhizobium canariense]